MRVGCRVCVRKGGGGGGDHAPLSNDSPKRKSASARLTCDTCSTMDSSRSTSRRHSGSGATAAAAAAAAGPVCRSCSAVNSAAEIHPGCCAASYAACEVCARRTSALMLRRCSAARVATEPCTSHAWHTSSNRCNSRRSERGASISSAMAQGESGGRRFDFESSLRGRVSESGAHGACLGVPPPVSAGGRHEGAVQLSWRRRRLAGALRRRRQGSETYWVHIQILITVQQPRAL